MAYIECKIWPFSDDDLINIEERWEAMKTGHRHYTVKALIDTSSSVNSISKSLADKLGIKNGKHYRNKNSLGTIYCLDLSFQYKGKDRLLSKSDSILNDFKVNKDHYLKADLILGIQWLGLREAKIDMSKIGLTIYGNFFIPFCKGPDNVESFYDSEAESSESAELRKKVKKLERTVDWIGNYVEEQTGLEPCKEISSESSSSETDYEPCKPTAPDKSGNKKVKRKRYPPRSVNVKSTKY